MKFMKCDNEQLYAKGKKILKHGCPLRSHAFIKGYKMDDYHYIDYGDDQVV